MKRSRLFEYNIIIKGDPKEKLGIFTQSRINIKVKLTAGRITLLVRSDCGTFPTVSHLHVKFI